MTTKTLPTPTMTMTTSEPRVFNAVQVLLSGPLTTEQRTTEGVRRSQLVAAGYLQVDPDSLMLDDVQVIAPRGFASERAPSSVVYTFTMRPRDAG